MDKGGHLEEMPFLIDPWVGRDFQKSESSRPGNAQMKGNGERQVE